MSYWEPRKKLTSDEKIAFEKTKLDYCISQYEEESKKKEILEGKSRFYLSFITLLLGSFLLKHSFFQALQSQILLKKNIIALSVFRLILIGLGASLLMTLFFVLMSIRVQKYKVGAPQNFIAEMFGYSPEFEHYNKQTLLNYISTAYGIAFENNKRLNSIKARWVEAASLGTIFSISFILLLLGFSAYMFL